LRDSAGLFLASREVAHARTSPASPLCSAIRGSERPDRNSIQLKIQYNRWRSVVNADSDLAQDKRIKIKMNDVIEKFDAGVNL
jgi:hypothetical protein